MNTTLTPIESASQKFFAELRQDRIDIANEVKQNPSAFRFSPKQNGCIFDSARGWTILPQVVHMAINLGFDPSEEYDRRYSEYLARIDEETGSTFNADICEFWQELASGPYWDTFILFESAENYLNTHIAPSGFYFSHHADWGDWGLYRIDDEDTDTDDETEDN